jgi:predicted RNA methylase
MTEFDYQWKNLPSEDIEYNDVRINEFLSFNKLNPEQSIQGKDCLDAGYGIGRYTYAMQKLGANKVNSLDISSEA